MSFSEEFDNAFSTAEQAKSMLNRVHRFQQEVSALTEPLVIEEVSAALDRASEIQADAAELAATASMHLNNGLAAEGAAYARAAAELASAADQLRRDWEK